MEFYNSNPFTEQIRARRLQLQAQLGQWLAQCKISKRIQQKVDAEQAAAALFAVYTSALRDWIVQEPVELDKGRERLRYLLAIPVHAIER